MHYSFSGLQGVFQADEQIIPSEKTTLILSDRGMFLHNYEGKRNYVSCGRTIIINDFSLNMLWKPSNEARWAKGFNYKVEGSIVGDYNYVESQTFHHNNSWWYSIKLFEWEVDYHSDGLFCSLRVSTHPGKRTQNGEADRYEQEALSPVNVLFKFNLPYENLLAVVNKSSDISSIEFIKSFEDYLEKIKRVDIEPLPALLGSS